MRKSKNILTWVLMISMLCSLFLPVQKVEAGRISEAGVEVNGGTSIEQTAEADDGTAAGNNAEENTETGTDVTTEGSKETGKEPTTEDNTETGKEPTTEDDTETGKEPTTEDSTETGTGETTEDNTEAGTEASTATTEEPKTEETTQEKPNPDYVVSTLSPLTAKVIVLDPGHCSTHPGASGNRLKEEVVVLDITEACREALTKYGDVTVYMTRETGSCCRNLELGGCLIARNNYAKILDADFLISMHINAGRTNGANVLAAYKSGYNDNIRVETQKFGHMVLKELKALGIANRGLLLRKSGSGTRYSNGKLADYYSIVRNGVRQKIPSVIIEHGYISSASDCKKFFKTESKRNKVGQADAKAIISYYGLSAANIKGEFTNIDGADYYVTADGKKVTGWVKNEEKWYYFNPDTAIMQTGFMTYNGETVYLSPSTGEMLVGWFVVNNSKYLAQGNGVIVRDRAYSDGQYTYLFNQSGKLMKKGFHTVQDATYYVDGKRHVVNGVKKINGKYYGFDTETGQRLSGYQKVSGKYYYFDDETGVASRKQILTINGKRYYFGANGARKNGWVTHNGSKYYFNPKNGVMTKGWKKIKGKYYYFNKSSGKMQKNKWIGKYYVNSKGVRTKKR